MHLWSKSKKDNGCHLLPSHELCGLYKHLPLQCQTCSYALQGLVMDYGYGLSPTILCKKIFNICGYGTLHHSYWVSSQAAHFWRIIHSPLFSKTKDALVAPFAVRGGSSHCCSVSLHNTEQIVESNVKWNIMCTDANKTSFTESFWGRKWWFVKTNFCRSPVGFVITLSGQGWNPGLLEAWQENLTTAVVWAVNVKQRALALVCHLALIFGRRELRERCIWRLIVKVLLWQGKDCISKLYKSGNRCCVTASHVGQSQPCAYFTLSFHCGTSLFPLGNSWRSSFGSYGGENNIQNLRVSLQKDAFSPLHLLQESKRCRYGP